MMKLRRTLLLPFLGMLLVVLISCGGGGSSNTAPIADAGIDQQVTLAHLPVQFDAQNSSDAENDVLTYAWMLVEKPVGSNAILTDSLTATPSFSTDIQGDYRVGLVVNDGEKESIVDSLVITVVDRTRNIVLLIGDGMGFEQIRAAGMYANGITGSLSFEELPYKGSVNTLNARGELTDSAAGATAMAAGVKVDNAVISQQIPGDRAELETILEVAKQLGASTGLVTTTTISHATPAAFGAHEPNRANSAGIISDYLVGSRPNILLGGAQFVDSVTAVTAGYTVIEDATSLFSLDTNIETMVWGQFGETQMPYELDGVGEFPHLSESTETALDILDNDPDGFFLMIEGGRIDHAGHGNDLQRNIFETVEFAKTAQVVIDWAAGRTDTLIVVCADHETGGLRVINNNDVGNFPDVTWETTGHTISDVPVFSWGVNAQELSGAIDNTDIYSVMYEAVTGY
jgi:alkaline phosphatase